MHKSTSNGIGNGGDKERPYCVISHTRLGISAPKVRIIGRALKAGSKTGYNTEFFADENIFMRRFVKNFGSWQKVPGLYKPEKEWNGYYGVRFVFDLRVFAAKAPTEAFEIVRLVLGKAVATEMAKAARLSKKTTLQKGVTVTQQQEE